jgi:4-aminobutyrate aminotransferase-like enzyme
LSKIIFRRTKADVIFRLVGRQWRPPLIVSDSELETILQALDDALATADEVYVNDAAD